MSGIEVAGLVLGSFPILMSCLESYRKGFEPLEEWWNFRTHFITFVDEIRHQEMIYNENMTRLLDPIIADNDSLTALVRNAKEPRWTDGSLNVPLEIRLASEYERFLRIVERMEEVMESLKKLLQVKDSNMNWMESKKERPWEWHLKRFQISFSKGKYRKVGKLAAHNQKLQEILGYSERIIPIANARKSSEPVVLFEKIRQHACSVHNALKLHWNCPSRRCRSHQAHLRLRAETKSIGLNVLFFLEGEQESISKPMKQEVMIQPADHDVALRLTPSTQMSYVQPGASFARIEQRFEETTSKEKGSSSSGLLSKLAKTKTTPPAPALTTSKKADSVPPTPTTINPPFSIRGSSNSSSQLIVDLCSSLRNCQEPSFGVIVDEFDRQFQLSKSPEPGPAPDTARLISLPDIIEAYHQATIYIARQRRFQMAFHIASALLQIQMSPWLSTRWSKHDFYFLADSHTIYSDYPYVSQSFIPRSADPPALRTNPTSAFPSLDVSEEDTRAALFSVGIIILELIFGHNIESCSFRHQYYGPNDQPNDQTDICTARKWAQKVLGECGVEIADVVRRCLDCSFGPRPSFQDKRFREAVYEGVIKPLADHLKPWQVVMP
ncbi:hypothetical protein MMC22_011176 [Lobaria immixta]|nr:hypothetical protein [Lobaria immixta]